MPGEFLRRDRLLTRLDEAVRLPVTLVNGPAGAGKTLLVAHWLDCGRLPGPAAWLTLEAGDNQPGNFWAYVREALRGSLTAMPADLGVPAQAEHVESSLLVRLAAWINEQQEPALLVLDEFEHIDDPDVVQQLHDLVRHTAGRLRLVLISRTEPPLPLHRYRAAGELAEIRAADLALSCPETGPCWNATDCVPASRPSPRSTAPCPAGLRASGCSRSPRRTPRTQTPTSSGSTPSTRPCPTSSSPRC
ncbi:AAA family ATPase [Streptacidiphilus monticola]